MTNKLSLFFYYSLGGIITLTLATLFFFTPPINFLLLIVLAPIGVYVILAYLQTLSLRHHTHPEVDTLLKRVKRNIVYFCLALTALNFSFFTTRQILFSSSPPSDTFSLETELKAIQESIQKNNAARQKEIEVVLEEIKKIKPTVVSEQIEEEDEKDMLSLLDLTPVLGTTAAHLTPSPIITSASYAKIKSSQWNLLDVYEDKTTTKVTGQIEYGKTYPVLKIEGTYFLLNLDRSGNTLTRKGWIHSEFLSFY